MIPKLSDISEETRKALALRVHDMKDFDLPVLKHWNYAPCEKHAEITKGCKQCAIIMRKHQKVGVSWLYLVRKGLIADSTGSGKTIMSSGLLAISKEQNELDYNHRALIVCKNPLAASQWETQLNRMLVGFDIKRIEGVRKDRVDTYLSPWEVILTGQQVLLRDSDAMENFPIDTIIIDDVDALRNRDNKTAAVLKRIALRCSRVVIMNATPLQKRLQELHSVLEPLGGREIFGAPTAFKRRYIKTEKVFISLPNKVVVKNGNKVIERNRKKIVDRVTGYQYMNEFVEKIAPLSLRRTAKDIKDSDIPEINPIDVWLEFTPAQAQKYKELQTGVMKILREKGTEIKRMKALAQLTYGAQICTGLATLGEPDAPNTSCKLDWLEDKLVEGDLSDEKVVAFMRFKDSIRAMSARLHRANVKHVIIWGESKAAEKQQALRRFWDDDECMVLLGSESIESSLDMQIAQHLVNVDIIRNPARMTQLAGRIGRDGSMFNNVYVHNLLVADSQEERYLPALEREQALINEVWSEESELFRSLPPDQLLRLITG